MSAKFGTSGLRGLVSDLTDREVSRYVTAFLQACDTGASLYLGQDLRPSSPRIAADIARAAQRAGCPVIDCGALPTPALALAAETAGAGAIMVTGSHIPADRNGLKFYTRSGEITKADEAAILAGLDGQQSSEEVKNALLETDTAAGARYLDRYVTAFGPAALAGSRIGVYTHSAVGRDLLTELLARLGAEVVELGRSDHFIPVDTEAVDSALRTEITQWVTQHGLDAVISTDGDADRPLLADETGRVIPGDILGQITAETLGAETVVTPISSNSGVTRKGFDHVVRTRIGSPYVIAGMAAQSGRVVGYEANGGFLLGFDAAGPAGAIAPLKTRDAVLPLLCVLYAARATTVSARAAQEPAVATAADRLQEVPQDRSAAFVQALARDAGARAAFLNGLGLTEAQCDLTDGVRMTLTDGCILHIRPSGNAPELRLYTEAPDADAAARLLRTGLAHMAKAL